MTDDRRICVIDYHFAGRRVLVPSREADLLAGHVHGWLYRIGCGTDDERRPVDPLQKTAPFGAWFLGTPRESLSVRVCWYDVEHADRSILNVARRSSCLLGGSPYEIVAINPTTRQPLLARDLIDVAEPARRVELSTISPLLLRSHDRDHLSFSPVDLLNAAIWRWNALWPDTLPSGPGAPRTNSWARVPVVSIRATTVKRDVGTFRSTAIRGKVVWDLGWGIRSSSQRRTAVALLRLAELVGLGARLAYGFGAVKVHADG